MEDGEHERRGRRSRGVKPCLLTLTLKFLLLTYYFASVSSLDIALENMRRQDIVVEHDVSIFVEKKIEYIHSRISLKPLISGLEHGFKLSNSFGMKANSLLGKILSSKLKRLVTKTEKKLESMINRNTRRFRREARNKPGVNRPKRAIEFVGNLISKLFGNPGPEEWRQNTRNLLAMKAAIERQLSNSVVLHNDIDQNRHAINEHNEILKHLSADAINSSNRLNAVDNTLFEFEAFLELESMFGSIIEILDMLSDIKRDAKMGRCNENGVNHEFLVEHLREIESNKAGIAPIFASWEWRKYYINNMCSLAIHEKEIWITMRIPVINLAEQMVRVLPLSEQIWIRNRLFNLGIETALFKNKQHDTFMIMTRNKFESCSKLDMYRICNVRDTKFKAANPYIVLVEIGYGVALIISNSTENNISAKIICKSVTNTFHLQIDTVMNIPEKCSVLGKTFEISRNVEEIYVNETLEVNEIERVIARQINSKLYQHPIDIKTLSNLPALSSKFSMNNNDTKDFLNSVKVASFSNTETTLIATSSSTGLLLLAIVLSLVVCKCTRKCKTRSNGPKIIVVNDEKRVFENAERANSDPMSVNECAECSNSECKSNSNKIEDKGALIRDNDLRRPQHQIKQQK